MTSFRQSILAALVLAASAAKVAASSQRAHRQPLLRSPAKGELLQTGQRQPCESSGGCLGPLGPSAMGQALATPAMDSQWFSEDAQRIAEMPPYQPDPRLVPKKGACNPVCTYSCGQRECDELCEPLCLPPKCETICTKSEDKCTTRCNTPKCAVLCPLQAECTGGSDCPKAKCRTVCAPPVCTTSCSDCCHSICSQPQCTWKCKPGNCPKPDCKLNCPGLSKCAQKFPNTNLTKVPIIPGAEITSEGSASLDPTILTQPAEAPPPIRQVYQPSYSTVGYHEDALPSPQRPPGAVERLKMKWEAEDMHEDNERLLRR